MVFASMGQRGHIVNSVDVMFLRARTQKSIGKDCGDGRVFELVKYRVIVKECGGGSICKHDKQRRRCPDCNGSTLR